MAELAPVLPYYLNEMAEIAAQLLIKEVFDAEIHGAGLQHTLQRNKVQSYEDPEDARSSS